MLEQIAKLAARTEELARENVAQAAATRDLIREVKRDIGGLKADVKELRREIRGVKDAGAGRPPDPGRSPP